MIKAHKISLNPTSPQGAYFYRASGVARFAWNLALKEYKRRKAAGQEVEKKWKLKIARAHERVSHLRNDFLHKFTSLVAKTFSVVCVEDLCLKGWIQIAGKATHDAGVGQAVNQLEYKTREAWGILQKVGRFFSSSKRCHMCGYINDDLQLSDRIWKCPGCGVEHDRDENAAVNIEKEGVSLLAGSGYIGVTPVEFAASALKFASM